LRTVATEVDGPKREEVLEGRQNYPRRCLIPNIFRVIRVSWAGYLAHMREVRSAWNFFVRKPVGKRLLV
jgi:hypothetical protein